MAFVQVLQFPKFSTPIKQILPEMFHSGWHKVKTMQNFLYIATKSLIKKSLLSLQLPCEAFPSSSLFVIFAMLLLLLSIFPTVHKQQTLKPWVHMAETRKLDN